uniref:Uncharacterized protein n=1 Tax=Aegilops tauschii subsp. strangulata TaxID=200361 RepID=A0A453P8B6_AEGTS
AVLGRARHPAVAAWPAVGGILRRVRRAPGGAQERQEPLLRRLRRRPLPPLPPPRSLPQRPPDLEVRVLLRRPRRRPEAVRLHRHPGTHTKIAKFRRGCSVYRSALKCMRGRMQSHTVSDHEVVFLNERTARKRSACAENPCAACARPLSSGHDYCSLFCKVKHLGESERGLRCALRVNRKAAAAGEEAAGSEPQNGKRPRASSSKAGPSCGGSSGKRSRKQLAPARSPFC